MKDVVKEFDFENGRYEVRRGILADETVFAVFSDNKRANGYTYSKRIDQTDIPDQMLIDLAEMDVKDHLWESNVEAWRKIQPERNKS